MVIRGAPAIGVAAAMGIALGMRRSKATGTKQFTTEFQKTLRSDGGDAADRRQSVLGHRADEADVCRRGAGRQLGRRDQAAARGARRARSTTRTCRAAGRWARTARRSCRTTARILTHCNAGALATAGYGTALGVIRAAAEQGKTIAVLADETRPFLQGARLTAWELVKDGIDTTVITDNMAGSMMRLGNVDLVVVGADRIAANGDVANKIGTYGVAVLAKEHGIPFYVAAPLSTIDLNTPDGSRIPIEERNDREVTHVGSSRLTPEGAHIRNPAFDVTPAKYVTAIITERGIARAPFAESLPQLVRRRALLQCTVRGSTQTGELP